VERAILPSKMARPSLRDRVPGRTLAAFQARVPAKITLVNDDGVLAETALDQHSGDAARWIATLRHFWRIAGKRRSEREWKMPCALVELRGFEPLTPCVPSMCG
jgi:hypothetical protein